MDVDVILFIPRCRGDLMKNSFHSLITGRPFDLCVNTFACKIKQNCLKSISFWQQMQSHCKYLAGFSLPRATPLFFHAKLND